MIHPTDEQLQQYLDRNLNTDPQEIDTHLAVCADCRHKLATYKSVFTALRADPVPALSDDFSRRVINTLKNEVRTSPLFNEYIYGGAAVIIALITLFILAKPVDVIARVAGVFGKSVIAFFDSLKPLLGGRVDLVVLICLILILVEILDYKFLRPRLRGLR